jgi:hypothetical protein
MPKSKVPDLIKGVKSRNIEKEKQNIILIFLFVLINALAVILFYNNTLIAFMVLLILGVLFILNYKSNILIAVFIVGLFVTFLEMLAVSYGVWRYANPDFVNIPIWLFILWGNVSIAIYRIAIELERIGFHN